jgi:hypothetical protein
MGGGGGAEAVDHVGGLEHRPGGRADQQPGVVVDDVEDLHVGAVGQLPVGDVGLPAFIRHLRGEPHIRRPRSFLRLRGDAPPAGQDPPDRRDRRRLTVPLTQVEGDGRRPGVQALLGQPLAQLDDLLLHGGRCPLRARPRPPRPRLKTRLPVGLEPANKSDHPPPGHPVLPGDRALRPALDLDRGNHKPCQRHSTPPRVRCALCRETSVNYVVKPDIVGGAASDQPKRRLTWTNQPRSIFR